MIPIFSSIFFSHVVEESHGFISTAKIIKRKNHDAIITPNNFVENDNTPKVILALRPAICFYVGVARTYDKTMPDSATPSYSITIPKALLVALHKASADTIEAVRYFPADRSVRVRRLKIMGVTDAVLPDALKETVALELTNGAVVATDVAKKFRIVKRSPVGTVLVVPGTEHFARRPKLSFTIP